MEESINVRTILFTVLSIIFILTACHTPKELSTEAIPAVSTFDPDRYLGTWYEIARLPHSFEEDLDSVTATYRLKPDGEIAVINRGYDTVDREWEEAEGTAWIPDPEEPARLRVSFFWFFSSLYKIIALDTAEYQYSVVTSSSKNYLWILNRKPEMPEAQYEELVAFARQHGFPTDQLYKVAQ